MLFATWLKEWLSRHPLKVPDDVNPKAYTHQVMARVKAFHEPARHDATAAVQRWLAWPQLAMACGAVAAGVLVAITVGHSRNEQLAREITRDAQVLAEMGEPVTDPVSPTDVDGIAEDMATIDAMTLAEAPQSDDAWLKETLQLLDQLQEDVPDDASSGDAPDEEWMKDLQTLDDSDLSQPS